MTRSSDKSSTSVPLKLDHPVICIVGPTASGKSQLAQEIALRIDGEVVSADSMQIYRGMDIGTGKVSAQERKVPHWGIDICDPGYPYSASLFQAYARECFKDIDRRKKRAILCGGTGFYVRAAIDDLDFPAGEQRDNPIRDHYSALAKKEGAQALWQLLYEQDPKSAELIHPHNVRRVIRAFEMAHEGVRYAEQSKKLACILQKVPAVFIGLSVDRDILREIINDRVDTMIKRGLVEEVKVLLQNGFRRGITSAQAIGYKEIVAALDGECTLDQAILNIKTSSHRYAKKQRTWFKKDARIHWLSVDPKNPHLLTEKALTAINHATA